MADIASASHQMIESAVPFSKSTLLSLKDLPYRCYLGCSIDKNYESLGQGTQEELENHFTNTLYPEFCEAISTDGDRNSAGQKSVIAELEIKIARLQMLIDMAKLAYDPDLLNELKEDGFNFPFTEESYLQDLEKVVVKAKKYIILKNQYLKALGELENEGENTNTWEYAYSLLNAISDMAKRDVDENVNTLRFCRYYVQLIHYIEKRMNDEP